MARLPLAVRVDLLNQRLVDVYASLAHRSTCVCRFHGGAGKGASRIDPLLVDTRLAMVLRGAEPVEGTRIKEHAPVRFVPGDGVGGAVGGQMRRAT